MAAEGLFLGEVVHKRLRPVEHMLRYRVFSLLIDPDQIGETAKHLRIFSHNRFNILSFYDSGHGDGEDLPAYLRRTVRDLPDGHRVTRFLMLCYPRVLGYVFNPLTVYFALDSDDETVAMLYEVNNTFGQRKTYVLPVETKGRKEIAQSCAKELYVSPFNDVSGTYSFRITPPTGDKLSIGVALRTEEGPLLTAYFKGARHPLNDRALFGALLKTGLLTVKVIAGIHVEALRLWLKGLRMQPRPVDSGAAVVYGSPAKERS